MFLATLLGDASEHCQRRLVQSRSGQAKVLLWQGPLFVPDSLSRKHCFIYKDDTIALAPSQLQLTNQSLPFFFGLLRVDLLVLLIPSILQLLDPILPIDLSKQCRIQMGIRESF